MKKFIFFIICNLLIRFGITQTEIPENDQLFQLQQSIDLEAFSIGYSIWQKTSRSFNLGFGLQVGTSYRYIINNPKFIKRVYNSDTGVYVQYYKERIKPGINSLWNIAEAKIFYRFFLLKNTYLNLGGFVGFGFLRGTEEPKVHFASGLHTDIVTGYKRFKFGSRVQLCNIHITYNSLNKSNMLAILVAPLFIQFQF